MTFAVSGPLQAAIYDALVTDVTLNELVNGAIYDALPPGTLPETYVSLGLEKVRDASDQTGYGAVHTLQISVITAQPGFATAKAVAGAISDVLQDAELVLSRGRLVYLRFERADARKIDSASAREIQLRFRARVED